MQESLVESFDYLAPEYIEGSPVDARVDIYGLGCFLYEALTGEVPYPAPTPAAKMYAQRSADPPSVRARRAEVPDALDAVVKRAMAKDPSERFQSAGEFAVEAAGAVAMSAPMWATRPTAEGEAGPAGVRQQSPPADGDSDRSAGVVQGQWSGPSYFGRPRPVRPRQLVAGLAMLLFVAAPIALVLALVLH